MIKNLAILFRDVGLYLLDRLFILLTPRPETQPQTLLVVRLDEIGDFVVWLNAAEGLRQRYPGWRICLAANEIWADLAGVVRSFDEVIPVRVRSLRVSPLYRYRLLQYVRRRGFHTVIHPVYFREKHFPDAEAIVRTCGAVERIGSTGNGFTWRSRVGSSTYTRRVDALPQPAGQLRQNAWFVRELGMTSFRAGLPRLPALDDVPDAFPGTAPYFVLLPGAGSPLRMWPLERFAKIARRIHDRTGWVGVICGSSSERALGEQLAVLAEKGLMNWAGRTTVKQLAGIISSAKMVLGNETSGIHLAAARDVPAVCILGGGHFGHFVPYELDDNTSSPGPSFAVHPMDCFRCNWKCIYPLNPGTPAPCIDAIQTDDVWAVVEGVLARVQVGSGVRRDP